MNIIKKKLWCFSVFGVDGMWMETWYVLKTEHTKKEKK